MDIIPQKDRRRKKRADRPNHQSSGKGQKDFLLERKALKVYEKRSSTIMG